MKRAMLPTPPHVGSVTLTEHNVFFVILSALLVHSAHVIGFHFICFRPSTGRFIYIICRGSN